MIKGGATVTAGSGDIVINAANAEVDGASAIAKVSGSGKVGVGASVALNVIPVNVTRAEIEDGAIISGGHDLSLSSVSGHSVTTYVEAGSAGGTAVSPAVAIDFVKNDTTARVGTLSGSTLAVSGDVSIEASHTGTVVMDANATAAGEKVAVGAVLGINVVVDSTSATLQRNLAAGGAVTIAAHTIDTSSIEVTASAKGNKGEDEGGRSADDESSAQVKATLPRKAKQHFPNQRINWIRVTALPPTRPAELTEKGEPVPAGRVWQHPSVLTLSLSETDASVADGIVITAGGALGVIAESETDMTTKAIGAAINMDSKVGVGAAVAMNVAVLNNKATVGSRCTCHRRWHCGKG